MVVGGLDRREDARPAVPLEKMGDPPPGLSRRDAEENVVAADELLEQLRGPGEERLTIARIGSQPLERGLVPLGKTLGGTVGPGQNRKAGTSDRPTIESERARVGGSRPCARKVAA
jgi:hypothetical protein